MQQPTGSIQQPVSWGAPAVQASSAQVQVKLYIELKHEEENHCVIEKEGWSGAVNRASDFGPRGPWFDFPPVHISLWP